MEMEGYRLPLRMLTELPNLVIPEPSRFLHSLIESGGVRGSVLCVAPDISRSGTYKLRASSFQLGYYSIITRHGIGG